MLIFSAVQRGRLDFFLRSVVVDGPAILVRESTPSRPLPLGSAGLVVGPRMYVRKFYTQKEKFIGVSESESWVQIPLPRNLILVSPFPD